MEIRKYGKADEALLFDLLVDEGDEWSVYQGPAGRDKYGKVHERAYLFSREGTLVCGSPAAGVRQRLRVYIYDLLVRKSYRGRRIGKRIMERVCRDFPDQPVYVMSDADPYYEQLGYRKEGSIFQVRAG
jgi:GNAT superfamily N-acetyltransferase